MRRQGRDLENGKPVESVVLELGLHVELGLDEWLGEE